jgi:hypothetical protein
MELIDDLRRLFMQREFVLNTTTAEVRYRFRVPVAEGAWLGDVVTFDDASSGKVGKVLRVRTYARLSRWSGEPSQAATGERSSSRT